MMNNVALLSDSMLPCLYRVQHVWKETPDTFTFAMLPTNGARNGSFAAGQYNMLYVFGVGEVPISISGDPTLSGKLMHTTREVGVVTRAMRKLKVGQVLGVRGPFGNHWPVKEAIGHDVVLVAGGIGLAPLRPVLYQLLAQRDKYARVVLLYGTRSPDDMLYRHELEHWRARFDLEVYVTVDYAMGDWRGNVGVVTTLISKAPFDARNTVAMVCGPEVMMRFTAAELMKRGVDIDTIFLSLERNMKCGIGLCGHCQFGPNFVCRDGPVFSYRRVKHLLAQWEV